MQPSVFTKPFSQAKRSLWSIFSFLLIVSAVWLGVYLDNSAMASTAPPDVRISQAFDSAIATQPNVLENLRDKVKNDLGEKNDSVEPVVGRSKRNFDNSAKQVEDTGLEVDGRTEENIAKIQGKAPDSESGVEDAIEDVMNNIKDRVN